MKNFIAGKRVYITEHSINFNWREEPDAGFSFDADEDWKVDTTKLAPAGLENYNDCTNGELDVTGPHRKEYTRSYWEPATGKCECGATVSMALTLVNTCMCGREYNSSGQRLAPRDCWGDDTGESISEIMMGNIHFDN